MITRLFSLIILCCCMLASSSLAAQRLGIGGFKLKKVGASIGQDQDMLGDMSASYFLSTARSGDLKNDYSQLDLLPSDTYSMVCENPHLRLNVTWEHDRFSNLEFGTNSNYLTINQYSNEVAVEPTLGWRMGKGPFNLTAIVGGNLGYHWGKAPTSTTTLRPPTVYPRAFSQKPKHHSNCSVGWRWAYTFVGVLGYVWPAVPLLNPLRCTPEGCRWPGEF